ncbi:MAG TPA: hypothetical protein ENJ00_06955 [Phycisphaerales bacterium]|nr:hypothetical protein [Phycisphaerales bacterium]
MRTLVAILVLACLLAGCRRVETVYPQGSPDEVIQSLEAMVKAGDARRIPDLIYAEDDDMRLALRRFGRLAGRLQELGEAIQKAFPEEVEKLRKDTLAAAERGEATSIMGSLAQSAMKSRRSRRQENPGDSMNLALRRLLVDPYTSFEQASDRFSTVELSDDTAGLLFDGQIILAPFGIMMRRDIDEKWYIVLPLDIPILSKYRPRTAEQWLIAGYLMRAWENVAADLKAKIESGELRSLDAVAQEAGIMLTPPTMMIGIAYSKSLEEGSE